MKTNKILYFILIVTLAFLMVGCDKDEDNLTTLNDYLVENSLDLPNILDAWIITASAVNANLDDYYVIDTRSAEAYAAGHIPGAVLANASDILDVAGALPKSAAGKTIVLHCYKGVGATRLLVALRLSGYPTAKSLKFGMSAWGPADAAGAAAYDKWTKACSDVALGYPNDWVMTGAPAADVEYDYPDVATKEVEDGADLLAERIDYLLTEGYGYAGAPSILTDREDYFINNFWDQASWDKYGHIAGSHRVNSMSIENGGINYMDPDETVVTYCWTSQTSGMITAYLTVLGYTAQSLHPGANGLIWSNLEGHNWDSANGTPGSNAPGNYEIVQ